MARGAACENQYSDVNHYFYSHCLFAQCGAFIDYANDVALLFFMPSSNSLGRAAKKTPSKSNENLVFFKFLSGA